MDVICTTLFDLSYFHFVEISSKMLQADLRVLREDILKSKTELYDIRDKLEKLSKDYEESKRHDPTHRYSVLKEIIKEATKGLG